MKKIATAFILTLILMLPAAAWAQEETQAPPQDPMTIQDAETVGQASYWEENFSLTVSLKVWRTTLSFESASGNDIETTANMYGPAANITFREKFYAGTSFYIGNGFKYSLNHPIGNGYVVTIDWETVKSDFDMWVGYILHPRVSLFLGYKHSKMEEDGDFVITDSIVAESNSTLAGPVIGVSGNFPFADSGVVLFGTFGYAFLKAEFEQNVRGYDENNDYFSNLDESENDVSGPALEFGVSYMFSNLPRLSLSGGFKYQNYTGDNNDSDGLTFYGLTFGANYRF